MELKNTTVDFKRFAELVLQAKGETRTMQQFAADLGTHPSTLSRIVHMKNTGPSAESLLKAIAEQADPESGVTFDMLMEVNGKKDKHKLIIDRMIKFEGQCKDIVINTLNERNIRFEEKNAEVKIGNLSTFQYDFAVEIDNIGLWAFDVKMSGVSNKKNKINVPVGGGATRQWLHTAMSSFYLNREIKKVSLIVMTRVEYLQICEIIMDLCIPDILSVILVSMTTGRVVDEFCSLRNDGTRNEAILKSTKEGVDDKKNSY